jgi:hypothetical protein
MADNMLGMTADRLVYLTLMDSLIIAQMKADAKEEEAQALAVMWDKAHLARDHQQEAQISEKHSNALHKGSEYKGQYVAWLTMRNHMHRLGYKFF